MGRTSCVAGGRFSSGQWDSRRSLEGWSTDSSLDTRCSGLGFAGVTAWFIGSHLLGIAWIRPVAVLLAVAYATVVLFVNRTFLMAILMYLPATLFLLIAMVASWSRERSRRLLLGIIGLVLTFLAAGVQQVKIAIHPVYFDHNALYHLIQFVALWLVFVAARSGTGRTAETQRKQRSWVD
jgi:hypothetical protein